MLRFEPVAEVFGLKMYRAAWRHWQFLIGHDPDSNEFTASWKDSRKDLMPGRTPANYLGGGLDVPFRSWTDAEKACEAERERLASMS